MSNAWLPRPRRSSEALSEALGEALPVNARDGGFIREGADADLDEHRRLRDGSRQVIAGLQATYAGTTGIKSLKVRHNNVLGYFVEVTALHGPVLTKPPHVEIFIHRQTLANVVRFSTPELAELEARITQAADRALALELEIFARLSQEVLAEQAALSAASAALAELDHYAGLAELAVEENYVRPKIDHSLIFAVEDGRHPMVEQTLRRSDGVNFVGNDCRLGPSEDSDTRILVVTGPNMAGKSTFLRQNALIVVLAQSGSFVPARSAHVGIVDRLFSRVGAADDLARGRSTFMVEMVETASILNQASERSFVVLDEIGRGTATFDGLSIAWAALEYLHEVNRSRVLFATHYHELTALAEKLHARGQRHGRGQGVARRDRVPLPRDHGRRRPLLRPPRGEACGIAGTSSVPRRRSLERIGAGRWAPEAYRSRRRPAAFPGGKGDEDA